MHTELPRTPDRTNALMGALAFLGCLAVYTVTLTPTLAFWDAGEYSAAAGILGIPHAPGTPLYVLVARMFALLPFGSVAVMTNWMSALASAVAVLFVYLITVRIVRRALPDFHGLPVYMAGLTAASICAFGVTFWTNALEAEVYSGACALMAWAVWLLFKWEERLQTGTEDALLLIVTYIVALGAGLHLGVALVAWPAVFFVFAVRPHYLKRFDYLAWALVTLSLGAGIKWFTLLFAPVVLIAVLIKYFITGRFSRLGFWSACVFLAGLSVQLFLMVRANQDPILNETDPSDWQSLWLTLIRDQFKPGSLTDRKADWVYQFGHMWLRYLKWNFTLFKAGELEVYRPTVVLAVLGALVHLVRDRKTWVILGSLFVFLGPVMAFYLNFRVGEVRERDYFFVQNVQFLAPWIGLGAAWLAFWISKRIGKGWVGGALASVFFLGALGPLATNFDKLDRRGNWMAHNYAYNSLVSLEPNSLLLTNGDNDTFPLWYLQYVENFRPDVRVMNRSLMNTKWYIKQLRDYEPRVPIAWDDDQIGKLYRYRRGNRMVMVSDQVVRHILETNAGPPPRIFCGHGSVHRLRQEFGHGRVGPSV